MHPENCGDLLSLPPLQRQQDCPRPVRFAALLRFRQGAQCRLFRSIGRERRFSRHACLHNPHSRQTIHSIAHSQAICLEWRRKLVPLDWAMTQSNLGDALSTLGERESGTARLEEAVAVYRSALQERTRERVQLDWAATQNNLGNALSALGERGGGTARLEEAVAAYRAA